MKAYLISFLSVLVTSLAGQYFTSKSVKSDWYKQISPRITPPPIVFPVVWTILYILIAIAFGKAIEINDRVVVPLFVVNLIFNVIWCYVYFGLRASQAALLPMLVILGTASTITSIARHPIIRYLMSPYLAWLCFAFLLNILSAYRRYTQRTE